MSWPLVRYRNVDEIKFFPVPEATGIFGRYIVKYVVGMSCDLQAAVACDIQNFSLNGYCSINVKIFVFVPRGSHLSLHFPRSTSCWQSTNELATCATE